MLVSDTDAQQALRLHVQSPEGSGDAPAGDAGIQEEVLAVVGEQQAISGGAGGQSMEVHDITCI
jgi:hypothetical protein